MPWIVAKMHIDALLHTALEGPSGGGPPWEPLCYREPSQTKSTGLRFVTQESAHEVGRALMMENVRCLNHDRENPTSTTMLEGLLGDVANAEAYRYQPPPRKLTLPEAFKAILFYEMQSDEHPGCEDSEAFRFCAGLRRALIPYIAGYADAAFYMNEGEFQRPEPALECSAARVCAFTLDGDCNGDHHEHCVCLDALCAACATGRQQGEHTKQTEASGAKLPAAGVA
jgi:hypothetical protein